MKNLFDFSTGTLSSFGFIISIEEMSFFDSDTIVQLISALIGGIISTIVLSILRAKFPKLFKPISSFRKDHSPD